MGGDMIEYVYEQDTTFAPLPNKFEAGTQNVEGVVGLGAAIDYINKIGYDRIAEIEKQVHKKAKGGWKIRFYAVYRFTYGGKSYRRYGYRLPARLGPGLKPVAGTKLAVGDPVQVRVYLPVQDKLECRIEEPYFFWKAQLWVHIPVILVGLLFMGYGLYSAWVQLMYLI